MQMEATPLLAEEPDLQALHRAVARQHRDAERLLDQLASGRRHRIPPVQDDARQVLRRAVSGGQAEEHLEHGAGPHQHVRADAVHCGQQLFTRSLEGLDVITRPERAKAPLRREPADPADVLERVRSEEQPCVPEPLPDEAALDGPLTLGVGDVQQHRTAVVEERERDACRAGGTQRDAFPRVPRLGPEAGRVSEQVLAADRRQAAEVVRAADLPWVDSLTSKDVSVERHVLGRIGDRLPHVSIPTALRAPHATGTGSAAAEEALAGSWPSRWPSPAGSRLGVQQDDRSILPRRIGTTVSAYVTSTS